MRKVVRTACQGCHSECGVVVHVEDGKVVKIEGDREHPTTRGYICVKGRTYHELTYHPDRVIYPLRRAGAKAGGKWERVSWEAALSDIAGRLTEVREKYGPLSNSILHGTGPRASGTAVRLLAQAMGTPNMISMDLHICMVPGVVGDTFTVGHTISLEKGPDYLFSRCVLVVGANPVNAHPPRGMDILEAKRKNKARLIVIDPRETALTREADLWLKVRPGADGAMALALLNVIINEELYDRVFVEKWCFGFDKLAKRVQQYAPESVEKITWVPADRIREAARMYAANRPATLHQRVALNQNISSTQSSRAFISLAAITGNIDVEGGNLLPTPMKGYASEPHCKLDREIIEQRIGAKQYPLISGPDAPFQFVHADLAMDAMLTGEPYPIKASFLAGGNPVMVMENSKKVWKALQKLDLLVVTDFFRTPSAELADYILPAATWLERDGCCDRMYNNCITARQKAIEPLGESLDDMQIVIELAKRLPWADRKFLPWDNVDEYYDSVVSGMGLTFADLKSKSSITWAKQLKKYESGGFNTPTGKVELYSTVFEKHSYDGLPTYIEPPESPLSTPELLTDYPLILTTGARYIEYYHSIGRQIKSLRERVPDPELEIHPDAAAKLNIKEGDWVWIETPKVKGERVRFKAKLAPFLDPRVVHAAHAWWFPEKPAPEHGCFESNINVVLSMSPPRELICGSVPLRGTLCRVYK